MLNRKIRKVLIANRGEIALRIQKACKDLGINSVSVASRVDRYSLFARSAEELFISESDDQNDPYLNQDLLIEIAKDKNCQAIHPGYGFLSENSDFASKVEKAGLIFVGPSPESIKLLGDKEAARKLMRKYKVPLLPGTKSNLSDQELFKAADKIGFPLLIKATAGGGGRGIRLVNNQQELKAELPIVRSEASKYFSSDSVFLEKYLQNARHVEVQVLGDEFKNLIHVGLRECSLQRRKQKLMEECPAQIDKQTFNKIAASALRLLKPLKYKNAGTVEFLLNGKEFYCLEVNTRIQVEHPVTEEAYGIDLVKWQLKIAAGLKLNIKQKAIKAKKHAIEFRIYSEDPENNFSPQTGAISNLQIPELEGLRIDTGFVLNDIVSPYYDAMLAKVILSATNKTEAVVKARKFFADYKLAGFKNNANFFRYILTKPEIFGNFDINFIEREFDPVDLEVLKLKADLRHTKGAIFSYPYQSKKYKVEYRINISHEADNLFLCKPELKGKQNPKPEFCRFSNDMEFGMENLITEVLEQVPPAKIFKA